MDGIIEDIVSEVERVSEKHPPYHSIHEGYAVMLEEFDELWDEIKNKDVLLSRVYNEAKQVACTTIRFMMLVKKLKEEKGVL